MPPPVTSWREAASKLARAIKRQLAQTEEEIASFLNPQRNNSGALRGLVREPIPLPRRQTPRERLLGGNGARREFSTQARLIGGRAALKPRASPAIGVASAIRTEFGRSALRPRLQGTLRVNGYRMPGGGSRNFSTTHVNHAKEVYEAICLGIRAGVFNAPIRPIECRARDQPARVGHVSHAVASRDVVRTHLDFKLSPLAAALPRKGCITTDAVVAEIDDLICDLPTYMARLRRDLASLALAGDFGYTMRDNATVLRITFHGKDAQQVENYLDELGISLGVVTEDAGFLRSNGRDEHVDWAQLLSGKSAGAQPVEAVEEDDSLADLLQALAAKPKLGGRHVPPQPAQLVC